MKKIKKITPSIKGFLINRLIELSWGQFLVSKIQFILWFIIAIGVYNLNKNKLIIVVLIALFLLWAGGAIFKKYFSKDFNKKFYKGIPNGKDNNLH